MAGSCKNLPTNETLSLQAVGIKSFGAEMTEEGFVTLDQATAMLKDVDSLPLKLSGKVKEVCQNKGCWMNVVSENGESQAVFVKFKDYGFFVPKDCAGKKVIMEGWMNLGIMRKTKGLPPRKLPPSPSPRKS
jgi:hypothetical protein